MIDQRDWWQLEVNDPFDLDRPGVYEWRIGLEFIYVGKSVRLRKRVLEYPNNVRKLLSGEPYRKGKPTCFRQIHHELRNAYDAMKPVSVVILENCETSELNQREQHWISLRQSEALKGGPKVLNASGRRS